MPILKNQTIGKRKDITIIELGRKDVLIGTTAANNKSVACITFLDADDLLVPEKSKRKIQAIPGAIIAIPNLEGLKVLREALDTAEIILINKPDPKQLNLNLKKH